MYLSISYLTKFLETLVVNANTYAAEKRARDPVKEREKHVRGWKPVDLRELQCWIGIIIYMGIVNIPAVKDYWRSGLYPEHGRTPYLSATRFEQNKRYFHISASNMTLDPEKQSWHYMVDPLLNQLPQASQHYHLPSTNIPLDEAMT